MNTSKWLYIRVAVVAMFTTSAPSFAAATFSDDSLKDALPVFLLLIFVTAFFSVWITLKREYRFKNPRQNWDNPTWYTNPFSGPAQFIHLGSFCFMGLGFTGLLLTAHNGHYFLPTFPALVGLAIYLSLRRFYSRLNKLNLQKGNQPGGELP